MGHLLRTIWGFGTGRRAMVTAEDLYKLARLINKNAKRSMIKSIDIDRNFGFRMDLESEYGEVCIFLEISMSRFDSLDEAHEFLRKFL